MRRNFSHRIFLLFIVLLTFYFVWSIFNGTFRIPLDSIDNRVYLHAISRSSPIIQNVKLCSSDEIDLIIVIISSGSHFLERQSIRETWRSMNNMFNVHSQHLFIIGYEYGSHFYKDLLNEAQNEEDLLYLTINDSSMTLKELHAYRWLENYCSNVTYTFKTEDDLFINSFLLHEIIGELKTKPDQFQNRYLYNNSLDSLFLAHLNPDAHTFLFGWAFEPGKPERDGSIEPYYVSYEEFPKELYPRYCSGFGYLMDSKTRKILVVEGFKDKNPFRFSDIFITGILPERLNFICDVLPFTYNQGTAEECIDIIKQYSREDAQVTTSPVIVCSTGRHIGKNTFSDYYRIWTILKYIYGDKIHTTQSKLSKN